MNLTDNESGFWNLMTRDGLEFRGALTRSSVPQADRVVALVLQGSGNVDFDGDVSSPLVGFGLPDGPAPKLSLQFSESLVQAGVTTYRYSKRGVDHPDRLHQQTPDFLLQDLEDAWAQLSRAFPRARKIIVALSEGALLAVQAVGQKKIQNCEGLFLFGLPTRSIDDSIQYQFKDWPIQTLSARADASGFVPAAELDRLQGGLLPGVCLFAPPEVAHWRAQAKALGHAEVTGLSVEQDLPAIYGALLSQVQGMLSLPQFSGWYQGLKALPAFNEIATQVESPVFIYQGEKDAQLRANETVRDVRCFSNLKEVKVLKGLGHSFAPHLGAFSEVKTSGPLSPGILEQFVADVKTWMND